MNEANELIKLWFLKADHDLGTAKITYAHIPKFMDTVCYHCQQAVEKYLKAYLIYLKIEFRFTHDLLYLLDLITKKDLFSTSDYDKAAFLQDFAVEIRYPNDLLILETADVEKAIEYALYFRELLLNKMNIPIDAEYE